MKIEKVFLQSLAVGSIFIFTLVYGVPWVQSEIYDVFVNPEYPTENDDITLTVAGWLPDSCWSYQHGECITQNNYIYISLYTKDNWFPGLICLYVIKGYSDECNIGKLKNGIYFAKAIELRDSLRDSLPRYHNSNFVVTPENDCDGDFEPDGDVDGSDLAILIGSGGIDIDIFSEDFGRTDCL